MWGLNLFQTQPISHFQRAETLSRTFHNSIFERGRKKMWRSCNSWRSYCKTTSASVLWRSLLHLCGTCEEENIPSILLLNIPGSGYSWNPSGLTSVQNNADVCYSTFWWRSCCYICLWKKNNIFWLNLSHKTSVSKGYSTPKSLFVILPIMFAFTISQVVFFDSGSSKIEGRESWAAITLWTLGWGGL